MMTPWFKGKPNFVFALPCPLCGYQIQPKELMRLTSHIMPEVRRGVRRDGWPEADQHILRAALTAARAGGVCVCGWSSRGDTFGPRGKLLKITYGRYSAA
jgi:hypothetical protein